MSAKTAVFLGASTGVGLGALKKALAAGIDCTAICRTPSKLTSILPAAQHPNLNVVQGNAHDVAAVASHLKREDGRIVDYIVSTIGGKWDSKRWTIDDAHVCEKGMDALVGALAQVRKEGATGHPHITVCSTTGMSRFGRDVPILMAPLYHVLLKVPHKDKRIMEDRLVDSGETFTIVRASLLTSGESQKPIRAGIEDPKAGRESDAIGYTISREDAGTWIAQNLLLDDSHQYANKIAMITY